MKLKYLNLKVWTACAAMAAAVPAMASAAPAAESAPAALQQAPQSAKCTGVVTDDDGEPLIGATVNVVGTKISAATNIDGRFTLSGVKSGATLRVTYVGYKPVEVKWTGAEVSVTMTSSTTDLDEVVVVGYGVQKKVNLTGAVSQVKGEDLAYRPVGDAAQMLQGMIPGLTVSNSNAGRPGGSASLQLRGQGNLSGTGTPYILVDGVEMSLSDVNPNDIESISVLKDAGASAIYGARAAYGVVLVTTKRGEEGKMRVSYQGTVGWNAPTKLPEMLNGYEFAKMWNDGARNAGVARLYSDAKLELLRQFCEDPSSVDPWQEVTGYNNMNALYENTENGIGNTDYFDLHYKDWAFKQNHNISASGGGKRAQYYLSLGYYDEDGILRYADMGYTRYNFGANIRSEVTKWLRLRANTKFMHSDTDTPFGSGGLSEGFYHSLARFRPTVHHTDMNGHFTELTMIPYLQSGTYTKSKRDRFNVTIGAEVEPIKDWKINVDYTYRYIGLDYEALNVAPDIYDTNGDPATKGTRPELGIQADGQFYRQNTVTRYQTFNLYTDYHLTVADVNNFSIMAGYQSEHNQYSALSAYNTGLYSTATPGITLASGTPVPGDTRQSWSTRGFYGRFNYDYDGRYLLEVNMRYDGTSRFAKNNRWGFFPSVSLGWNIAREKFWESLVPTVNNLKLRGSWGRMGNQAGAALYTFASTMGYTTKGNYWFGDVRDGYINAPGVISPTVTWEKVESKNIGLDFGLFNNALTGTFELFQRDTKDMLGPGYSFPDYFGASAPQANNASMRNRGWELQINWNGRIGKDIVYSIGGSVSDANAVVTEYSGYDLSDAATRAGINPISSWYPGRPVGDIWGLKSSGLIQTQEEADAYNRLDLSFLNGGVWTPGDVKYVDLNGDGKINRGSQNLDDMGDYTVIGNTTPRYEFTLNGMISWKGLSLSVMFQGVGKRDWNPGTAPYFWGWGAFAQVTLFNQHTDYWTEDNPGAYYPKPYIHNATGINIYQNRNKQTSDRYLQNAAYIRLKNLTLAYDLPKSIINHVGLQGVRVFFTGENLWTGTKLAKMFDPEAIFTSNGYTSEGGKNYPMNKVLSVGLTVNL
ncbi:MAG: TonB-dependent receptor [Muribaculaceae bacterium]|nr:TonB-dependent receptor [Muribaculaceae bacterium]